MKRTEAGTRKSDGFFSGVLVLSVSTVLVKIIGLAYKIPMLSYLGAQGMGYFNSAAEIYAALCVVSTAGLPVALSMLVSASSARGDHAGIRRIDRSAKRLFLLMGTVGTALMWLLARELATLIGNKESALCILAIAPALLLVCYSSSVRGYFQGLHRMLPTAVSQLLEALGKLIFGVFLADYAIKRGYALPTVAAFAALGLTLGTLLSAIYLWILRRLLYRREKEAGSAAPAQTAQRNARMGTLLRIAVPITLSASVSGVTRLSDMALMMRRLQDVGLDVSQANVIYGSYTTLAVPVFGLIPSLIAPIALVSVPRLSAAIEGGSAEAQGRITERSLRLTVLLALPSAMGISLYARPILSLLFSGQTEAVAIAAPMLSLLGMSVLFSGLITTTNALLQSYRQTVKPILSMGVGALVKIAVAYWLIGIPSVGAYGAPLSTLLCDLTVTVMNLAFLGRCTPKTENAEGVTKIYWKPLGASTLAILFSLGGYVLLLGAGWGESLAFFAAAGIAAIAYGALLLLFGCIAEEDVAALPLGGRLLHHWNPWKKKEK